MTETKDKKVAPPKEWKDDVLDRKKEGDYLTKLLTGHYERYKESDEPNTYVLNLHAEWGFGKTFFLKKWAEDLKKAGHPVVYFDAWQNDFCEHPLLAFLSKIKESLKIDEKDKNLKELGNLLETGFIGITNKLTGINLDKVEEKNKGAFAQLNDFKDTKKAIKAFKKGMISLVKDLTKEDSQKLPLFIIVDELDRCRPNFSIELLENIKHLFGVDGVYFVVATDTNQLACSVQALYGQNFDGRRYLQRFFDQEFTLPNPDNRQFAAFLFQKHKLLEEIRFFTPLEQKQFTMEAENSEFFSLCSTFFKLGLREQMQCCEMLENLTLTWKYDTIHLGYLLPLIMLYKKDQKTFSTIHKIGKFFDSNIIENYPMDYEYETYIQTRELVNTQGYSPTPGHNINKPIADIITFYHSLRFKNLKELDTLIVGTFAEERIRDKLWEDGHGSTNQFLLEYPKLVKQVGYIK